MNVKRIATLGLICGAVAAAWLVAAASTSGSRPAATHADEQSVPVDKSAEALANEIARLHERLRPSATPLQPGRNLFQFTENRPPALPVVPEPVLPVSDALPAAAPPAMFKLIGMAEDPGPEGPVRTAIVSGAGQLFLVKQGENVTARYRVAKISADVVELTDLGNGATLRLALK